MKALIIAGDSVAPEVIFKNLDRFPTFQKMAATGVSGAYSAYAQKRYNGSYLSEQNWASIYTGFSPDEHGISYNAVRSEKRPPEMKDFAGLQPFWEIFNKNGLSVGLWAANNCASPTEIQGYAISAVYTPIETPINCREAPRTLQVCEKDKTLLKYLEGDPPPRLYPRTLAQQGYEYAKLKQDDDLALEAVGKYHFQESIANMEQELDYFFSAMGRTQREVPVDVLYFFTPTPDIIAHSSMCDESNDVLIETYALLDRYIGVFVKEFNPETVIFLSDHGQQNFKELINCSDLQIRREVFDARDEVLWLKNGYIAFEAHNGALLFSAHSLHGTFIMSGRRVKHAQINQMWTLDIYPTLLELFNIDIPEGRKGFVIDVFDKPIRNRDKMLPYNIRSKSIALIQTHKVSVMDVVLNELYNDDKNRFALITVVGEDKYRELFLNNPRVSAFVSFQDYEENLYDEVYCAFFNESTNLMNHTKLRG